MQVKLFDTTEYDTYVDDTEPCHNVDPRLLAAYDEVDMLSDLLQASTNSRDRWRMAFLVTFTSTIALIIVLMVIGVILL